ncbi:MAG: cation:proton antiporter [Deltaproteobacteria bacterium]|nr:cation:proton antiporter [Deltaproteobacteria bacterium]
MEGIPLLKDIVIIMAVSVPVAIALTKVGLPTIVGFFLTGMIIGPYGFGLIAEKEAVEVLAEIGIVLLLFTIGLEFSVTRMLSIKREAMIGGALQLILTILPVYFFMTYVGLSFEIALLVGFVVAMSSSAIVLKLLVDRVEVNSSHGKLSVGILLFQDIGVVLMVLVIQGFGEGTGVSLIGIGKEIGVALASIVVIVLAVAYFVPKLFYEVVKLRNREVFMLTIVLVCLGTAWVTSLLGLSLAIGAFIAGLAISESEYSNQIVAEVLPFRDTFSSLFFISIGMLIEISFIYSSFLNLIAIVVGIIILKALVVIIVGQVLKYPLRLSIIVGLNLAQIGEFAFILIMMGNEYEMLPNNLYQTLLAASVMTMAITPFFFEYSPNIAAYVGKLFGYRYKSHEKKVEGLHQDHVIIVGYGLNGKNLARVLKETAIEHVVMDINSVRIKQARKSGHIAHFGDSSHPEVLKRMGITRAKMLVLAVTDPVTTRRTVQFAREINPNVTILVRTRYIKELEELYLLGADQVITEEFETSVEVFARVLKEYNIPGNIIQNQIDLVRQEGYAMLRNPSLGHERLVNLATILETSVMETFYVEPGCSIEDKTLASLDIRKKCGATVMAIIRDGKASTNPRGDFLVKAGDMLVLLGGHFELNSAMTMLQEKCPTE